MVSKRGQLASLKTILILLVFLFLDMIYFGYEFRDYKNLTGFSIKTSIFNIYDNMSPISRFLFLSQWIVLVIVVIFIVVKDRRYKSPEKESIQIEIKENLDKKKTDLDVLYEILKKEKSLKLSIISKSFGINKEVAMEWCKILESGNLAIIDYPGFGETVIKILEDKETKENI